MQVSLTINLLYLSGPHVRWLAVPKLFVAAAPTAQGFLQGVEICYARIFSGKAQ